MIELVTGKGGNNLQGASPNTPNQHTSLGGLYAAAC